MTNDTYITATEISMLLEKTAKEYAGLTIHVVLNNARYQKCEMVTKKAVALKIELVYLPSYT